MNHPLRVGRALGEDELHELRREMELAHFKWDTQVGDVTSLAPFPLLVRLETWNELASLAERLAAETLSVEKELEDRPELQTRLGLPRPLRALFADRIAPTPCAARVMRFDFHWTTEGWRVSEVNSDVPGGYTEATSFTQRMADHFPGARPTGDPTRMLVEAISRSAGERGTIALMNAPGHMEDHQVVAYLASRLRQVGHPTHVIAPTQLRWADGRAKIETARIETPAAAIVRFYQAEWLARMRRAAESWRPLFVGGRTPVANPGVAVLSESKRLPLVWDRLQTKLPTWRRLLPETRELAEAPWASDDGWLIKSAYSNTGDTVSIRAEMPRSAWWQRALRARLNASAWVAQRRFIGVPLCSERERFEACLGVYTVDGRAAGTYGRITSGSIVDGAARDVAVLVGENP